MLGDFHEAEEIREVHNAGDIGIGKLDATATNKLVSLVHAPLWRTRASLQATRFLWFIGPTAINLLPPMALPSRQNLFIPKPWPVCAQVCALLCLSAVSLWAGDVEEDEVPQADVGKMPTVVLALPTWNETPQEIKILQTQPAAKRIKQDRDNLFKADPVPFQPLPINSEIASANAAVTESPAQSTISTQMLMPQATPPAPVEEVYFPNLSPAADIWLQGLAWVVEGTQFEEAGDVAQAIGRFQSARSAYEQVESRFPDWQPEIIAFRIGDLQLKIRQLVEKTATVANSKSQPAVEKAP